MKYILLLCLLLMLSGCYIAPNSFNYKFSYRKEGIKYPVESILINILYKDCDQELDIMETKRSNLRDNIGKLLENKNIRYAFYPIKYSFHKLISRQYWAELKNKASSMNMQGYIYIYIDCRVSGVFKYITPNVAINYYPSVTSYVYMSYFYLPSDEDLNQYNITYKRTDAYLAKARTLHNPIIYLAFDPVGEFPMDEVLKWIDKVTNP